MKNTPIGIRIPKEVLDELNKVAQKNNKSKSEVIIWLIKQYIAKYK